LAYSKEERARNKSILLATFNYLLAYHSQAMVFDDYSPSQQWYLSDLAQTERDIKNSRSKQIERRLNMHISLLRHRYDQGYNAYIKVNTGYDMDIFESYKAAVLPIIERGSIQNNDVYLVKNYLKAYEENPEEQENVNLLKEMLTKYNGFYRGVGTVTKKFCFVVQGNKSWTVDEEGMKDLHKDWLLYEETAPNGIAKLRIQFSGKGEHALTYINIALKGGEGAIYTAYGEQLPIKTYWKDNNTVVVVAKSEYKCLDKYQKVSSYGEVVHIEYVEQP